MRRCVVLFLLHLALLAQGQECRKKSFGYDSIVCVCDANHCDMPGPTPSPDKHHYVTLTSSRDGQRFHTDVHTFTTTPPADAKVLQIAVASTQQTMLGFGSSFTDAASIMTHQLSPKTQENLLRSYFGPDGIEYNLVRVPIAGTDFSTRPYSYLDNHIHLDKFQLAEEDLEHKLPLLRRAQELSQRPLKVLASPWSPPAWMKTNNKLNESGELMESMWNPWSDYIVRFIKAYEKEGVKLWGITTQNHAFTTDQIIPWNSCIWSPEAMRDWITGSLGPALQKAGLGWLQMLVGDEDQNKIPDYRDILLGDAKAGKFIDGVAVHWYADIFYPDRLQSWLQLQQTHLLYPDKYILYTEACIVPTMDGPEAVKLGGWRRGEMYAKNIIETVNQHVSGWMDWNLALDMDGGPNWAGNTVDSPIIINTVKDEFYKQPMYYVLGHFSKFVPAGSLTLPAWVTGSTGGRSQEVIYTTAFIHPDGHIVVVVLNMGESAVKLTHKMDFQGYAIFTVPGKAIQTILLPADLPRTHPADLYAEEKQEGRREGGK